MAFRYNVLCLDSIVLAPLRCNCADKEKWNGLSKAVINSWHKYKDHETMPLKISVEGIEYELVRCEYQPGGPSHEE